MTLPLMIAGVIASKCIPNVNAKAFIAHINGEKPDKIDWQKIRNEGIVLVER